METQVKERLTGAVILVALIVLLVPELLTGSGRPAAQPPASADAPAMRSYTIDLVEGGVRQQATSAAQPVAEAALAAQVVKTAPTTAQPERTTPQRSAPKPEQSAAAVEPAPAERVERAAAVASPSTSGWAVQLGSFASRDNAQRLVKELKGKGYAAFMLEGGGTSGNLYRVRIGPEPDRASATALAARLRRATGKSGAVVSQD